MLNITSITKTYNKNKDNEVNALVNISINLPKSGMFFIVGKSGSGKSTLLHILGGLDSFDSGEIIFNNEFISKFSEKDYDEYRNTHVGFVFQDYNLIESMSVKNNILLAARLQNKNISDIDLSTLIERLEINDLLNRLPNQLSGGQKQRVAIARALIKKPSIILADEPTGSLDTDTGNQIFEILKDLSKDKLVIVVSHDLDFANQYGDEIIELQNGEIKSHKILHNLQDNDSIEDRNIKSNLQFKHALPFVIKDLFNKPVRVIMMILLLTISFMLFGLAHAISTYQIDRTVIKSMEVSKIDNASIHQIYTYNDSGSVYEMDVNLSNSQLTSFQTQYENEQFFPVYDNFEDSYRTFLYEGFTSNYAFESFTGGIEITENLISEFNLDLIAGQYPDISTSPMQIAISKRVYDNFKLNGYRENNLKININNPTDMIGKSLSINHRNYTISGIIDTHYDDSKYQIIYDDNSNSIEFDILRQELNSLNEYSLHNLVFLGEGYNDIIISNVQREGTYEGSVSFKIYLEQSNESSLYVNASKISTIKTLPDDIIWKNNVERNILNNAEILLPINFIPGDISIAGKIPFNDAVEELSNDLIETFALEEFDNIKSMFDANFPGSNTYLDYALYIKTAITNEFQLGYNYKYFISNAQKQLLNNEYFDIFDNIILQGIQQIYTIDKNVEVVGFYDSMEFRGYSSQDVIFVSDIMYNDLSASLYLYDYSRLLVKFGVDHNDNTSFISSFYESKSNPTMYISNEIIGTINYIDNILNGFSVLALYFGLLFIVFASVLLSGYILLMISINEKDIGILRALGGSKKDLMKIYVTKSIFIGLSGFILGSLSGYIINLVINSLLISKYHLIVSIINFNFIQVSFIFIISMIVSLMSSIVPLYKLTRKEPIDVIKSL